MFTNVPEVEQPGSGSFGFQTSQCGFRTYVNCCAVLLLLKDKKALSVKGHMFNCG